MYFQQSSPSFLTLSLPAEPPTNAIDRARRLCLEAEIVRDRAAAGVSESRRLRSERDRWRSVWSEYCARPDHLLVCCAYCGRVRLRSGDWTAIPQWINQTLLRSPRANLSHGFCQDCLASHFP